MHYHIMSLNEVYKIKNKASIQVYVRNSLNFKKVYTLANRFTFRLGEL